MKDVKLKPDNVLTGSRRYLPSFLQYRGNPGVGQVEIKTQHKLDVISEYLNDFMLNFLSSC